MHQCTLPVIAAKKCQHGPQPHLEAHGAAAAVALRTGKAVGQSFSELEWWAMHALASSAGQIMCLCWQAAQPGPAWQLVSPWGCLQAHRQCSASTCVSGTCNNQTKVHAACMSLAWKYTGLPAIEWLARNCCTVSTTCGLRARYKR